MRLGALNDATQAYRVTDPLILRIFTVRENAVTYTVLIEGSNDGTTWYTLATMTNAATSAGPTIHHTTNFIRARYTAQGGASYIEVGIGWGR